MKAAGSRDARGYLVVRRLNWETEYPASVVARRAPPVGLSTEQVARRYRGFEGELWPGDVFQSVPKNEFDLVEPHQLDKVQKILAGLSSRDQYDLIYLLSAKVSPRSSGRDQNRLLGYDCGYFESSMNRYSVLLNEVMYGEHDMLRGFAAQLNEYLLFPSPGAVHFLAAARENLLRLGADLETDARCVPVAIMSVT